MGTAGASVQPATRREKSSVEQRLCATARAFLAFIQVVPPTPGK
jgi:hypothetical protein